MTRLSEILDQMTTVLNDLKTVMDAEQHVGAVLDGAYGTLDCSESQKI